MVAGKMAAGSCTDETAAGSCMGVTAGDDPISYGPCVAAPPAGAAAPSWTTSCAAEESSCPRRPVSCRHPSSTGSYEEPKHCSRCSEGAA
ncbi:unnamed protein product [Lampetra planeri]